MSDLPLQELPEFWVLLQRADRTGSRIHMEVMS
jgi:hypothetical protein